MSPVFEYSRTPYFQELSSGIDTIFSWSIIMRVLDIEYPSCNRRLAIFEKVKEKCDHSEDFSGDNVRNTMCVTVIDTSS
ncbi:hypothetical protein HSRCO_1266 [Halanaeroarchaeum sp. HSR-CO]|nr:hypothetical protein HSRCO_1266 [Halanaeroarchaeum sp. HSR-CO]